MADTVPKPVKMARAREWSEEVEELFRLQSAGFKSLREYVAVVGALPVRWEDGDGAGRIRRLAAVDGESWTYWRRERECEGKYVPKVKVYEYAEPWSPPETVRAPSPGSDA